MVVFLWNGFINWRQPLYSRLLMSLVDYSVNWKKLIQVSLVEFLAFRRSFVHCPVILVPEDQKRFDTLNDAMMI